MSVGYRFIIACVIDYHFGIVLVVLVSGDEI